MSTYYLLRAGSAVSRVVPLAVLYALAALAARLGYLVPSSARAAVRANIAQVLKRPATSREVKRAAATAFRCQALNYVDLMRMGRISPRELDATLLHGDLSPFTETVASGKGCIIVSGHLGNMDYVGQWLGLHGYTVHSVMERLQPPRLFDLIVRQRASAGLHFHAAEPEAIAALTEALRGGGVVALIADRDITGTGVEVELFGAPTRLPVGPALLALRTGAPIVPAFGHRMSDNRLYVTVRQPVQLERTRNLRADLREGVCVVARLLEEGIARAPEQWIVFEPVWKAGAA